MPVPVGLTKLQRGGKACIPHRKSSITLETLHTSKPGYDNNTT